MYDNLGFSVRRFTFMEYSTISLLCEFQPERPEKSGPCWLLKMRWMVTQRVQIKGVLICLARWACRAGTRYFCSGWPIQIIIFFLAEHYFKSFIPHRPSSWAGSRAGSLVSYYRSLDPALNVHSTIWTSFPMFWKRGSMWMMSVHACQYKSHSSFFMRLNRERYIYSCAYCTIELYIYYKVCMLLMKKKNNLCASNHI
jgi:hypothetical protein